MQDFIQLGISEKRQDKLRTIGIASPTPVQQQAIPHLLNGNDVITQAQTGTGKTISFILPILEKIRPQEETIQALVITPTRELALQITNEFQKLKSEDMNILAVYGGQDVEKQLKSLRGAVHIVVGTPGRLLDHIRRETIHLQDVSMLVLDEADQMLHIGFIHEVETIIQEVNTTRQTMLFSATLSPDVIQLAKKYTSNPVTIKINEDRKTLDEIKQLVYETTDRAKQATLVEILKQHRPYLAVIFCRTKRRVSKLNEELKAKGINCDELHGDLSQAKRERVLKSFRQADIQYLIATDVAARGLDIEGVTHVFNYDIPEDVDSYIHRIGRTGRAGGHGIAITTVAHKDFDLLHAIEKGIGMKIPRRKIEVDPSLYREEDARKSREKNNKTSGNRQSRGRSDQRSSREHREQREKKREQRASQSSRSTRNSSAHKGNSPRGAGRKSVGRPSIVKGRGNAK
ncbi:DEAD/DEAH box helicase [Bacillus sp. BGMRC 2118]|nr:DEAD/DEAH box helicase [Bacillus sp. BGMRC 2118]